MSFTLSAAQTAGAYSFEGYQKMVNAMRNPNRQSVLLELQRFVQNPRCHVAMQARLITQDDELLLHVEVKRLVKGLTRSQ